jgi:hypothetical protein
LLNGRFEEAILARAREGVEGIDQRGEGEKMRNERDLERAKSVMGIDSVP